MPRPAARRSGSVTISTSGVPPRLKSTSVASAPTMRPAAPPTWTLFAASSSRWTRTIPTAASPSVARDGDAASDAQRLVVLRYLVALRQVRVPVLLAVEDGSLGDPAAEGEPELDRPFDREPVRHGQRAGVREADRAGAGVLGVAEARSAAAEHLRPRLQVDVDLEPNDRLPRAHAHAPRSARVIAGVPGRRRSRARARARTRHGRGGSRRTAARSAAGRREVLPRARTGSTARAAPPCSAGS